MSGDHLSQFKEICHPVMQPMPYLGLANFMESHLSSISSWHLLPHSVTTTGRPALRLFFLPRNPGGILLKGLNFATSHALLLDLGRFLWRGLRASFWVILQFQSPGSYGLVLAGRWEDVFALTKGQFFLKESALGDRLFALQVMFLFHFWPPITIIFRSQTEQGIQ